MTFQDERQLKWSQQGDNLQPQKLSSSSTSMNNTSNHKVFNHCLYQNLALLFSAEHNMLKTNNVNLFTKMTKHLF